MSTSPFDELLADLEMVQRLKSPAPSRRDTAKNPAPMAKAAPVAPTKPVDFSRIEAEQDEILKAMRSTQTLATQNAVRERLAEIGALAKSGKLSVHQIAVYDVLRNKAFSMGLRP